MRLVDALAMIREGTGFRVEFETRRGCMLVSDHFPDSDEYGIQDLETAWRYAKEFAEAGKNRGIVNVYVIDAHDYKPVDGYKDRELNIYPEE